MDYTLFPRDIRDECDWIRPSQYVALHTRHRDAICRLCGRLAHGRMIIERGPQFAVCGLGPYRCADLFLTQRGTRFHRPPLSMWFVGVLDGIFIRRPRCGRDGTGMEIPNDAWMIIVAFVRPNGAYMADDYTHQSSQTLLLRARMERMYRPSASIERQRLRFRLVNAEDPDCNHSQCGFHCVCGLGRRYCNGSGLRSIGAFPDNIMTHAGSSTPAQWYPARRGPRVNVQCLTQ